MEISKPNPSEEVSKTGRGTFLKEVRCAVRFPLALPVEMADDKQHDQPACDAQRFPPMVYCLNLTRLLTSARSSTFICACPEVCLALPKMC